MNKKPGLLMSIAILALIILAGYFNLHSGEVASVHLRAGVNPDSILYVCPVADSMWDSIASILSNLRKQIIMGITFAVIVLAFCWGWALYQNLLKDKFNKDAYKNSWGLTKFFFWVTIVFVLALHTPNYFRTVTIKNHGQNSQWVLCESFSPNARAVSAKAVFSR
ncbi:MAG: hypothetical protein MJ158_02685 [Alphaproteobacteria bacterium]|nr:hypothetical protein [Alphaproteobacteria bacterium]